jgi:hypothetical protein
MFDMITSLVAGGDLYEKKAGQGLGAAIGSLGRYFESGRANMRGSAQQPRVAPGANGAGVLRGWGPGSA